MARGKHAGDRSYFRDSNYFNKKDDYRSSYRNINKDTYNDENDYKNLKNNNYDSDSNYNNIDNYNDQEEYDEYDNEYEDDRRINPKKVFIIIAVVLIIVLVFVGYKKLFSKDDSEEEVEPTNTVNMQSSIEGYTVLGKLKIEKINVEQYILDSTEDKALENGIGKLYGSSLNSYGNLCLAGHNYDSIFGKLSEIEEGDIIVLTDKKGEDTEYKVTSIDSVEPDNLECLLSDEDKVEITLITCKEGATQRLVVKAEENKAVEENKTAKEDNTVGENKLAEENITKE